MSVPIEDYSASRIGRIWGEDDHLYLVDKIRKIDDLADRIVRNAVAGIPDSMPAVEASIISDLQSMSGVRRVSVKRSGDEFDVFVVMENMDFAPFNAVIQKEVALYERHPDLTFHFDLMPASLVEEEQA